MGTRGNVVLLQKKHRSEEDEDNKITGNAAGFALCCG